MSDGVGICDFEPAFLQVVAVIENRSTDKKRALGIDDHAHIGRFHEDVAISRAINQIHLVLQPGTTPANDGDAQGSMSAALLLQKRSEFERGVLRHFDQPFVADSVINFRSRRSAVRHGKS